LNPTALPRQLAVQSSEPNCCWRNPHYTRRPRRRGVECRRLVFVNKDGISSIFRSLHRNSRPPPWTFVASVVQDDNRDFPTITVEWKSTHHGGDSMNRSRNIRPCRILASVAVLFGAMVTILLVPAYGQQEVDPTWYDPWAAPNMLVVHSSQPAVALHQHQPTVRPVSLTWTPAASVAGSDTQPDQARHDASDKRRRTPVCELSAIDPAAQKGRHCTSKSGAGS
jgi:hypothetical protein